MKHEAKVKLARKMAKRGASNIFTSKAWQNRKLHRAHKAKKRGAKVTKKKGLLW